MLKNHLKLAWRYLLKDRQFTSLNLIGLSTGLACTILIYLWVNDEWQMDKFHKKDARLFQVMENRVQASGIWTAQSSSGPMADALVNDMPQVEYATATVPVQNITLSITKEKTVKTTGKYAGKDFFHVFSYELIQGTADQVLTDERSIVLSDALAMKLFGNTTSVTGKTVEFQQKQIYKVSGVFKDPGSHSSDQFDFVLPI